MTKIEKSIEVKAPVEKVYALCIDVVNYPKFMTSVDEITKTGEKKFHWKMNFGGRVMEYDTEMVETVENRKLVWQSSGDLPAKGFWMLAPTEEGTMVEMVMDYEIPGIMGKIFDKVKISKEMEKNMETNLQKFKEILEGS